jgi:predicted homoserine dehydrogenase-like protein
MYIYQELAARAAAKKPVRVGLIGAGKFGSMFLSQISTLIVLSSPAQTSVGQPNWLPGLSSWMTP